MTNFTPGPWRQSWDYNRIGSDKANVVAYATGPQHVCKGEPVQFDEERKFLQPNKATMEKVYADARLISAAPDLCDALERMRAMLIRLVRISAVFGPAEYECLRDADIALAKAREER